MYSIVGISGQMTDIKQRKKLMKMLQKSNKELFQEMVQLERERQNKKFPNVQRQKDVSLEKWANILAEEFGEFVHEVNDHRDLEAVIELAETAAVCQRIAEVFFNDSVVQQAHEYMKNRTAKQEPKE